MHETTPNSILLKRIAITLAVIIGIIAIGWGVITLLKAVTPEKTQPSNEQGRILKVNEVIETFGKNNSIPALNPDIYQTQETSTSSADVIYKPASSSFAVATPTTYQALFFEKKASSNSDVATVQEQTTSFMKQSGYEKVENAGMTQSDNPAYVTYNAPLAVCQLKSIRETEPPSANLTSHQLSCQEKTAIQTEYDTINSLLTLYKESGQAEITFTQAIRTIKTEGNKSLTILSLSGDTQNTALLFAALDNKWSYLGNLSGNGQTPSNGKYVITSELRQAINDPRYGDFLTKNLQ